MGPIKREGRGIGRTPSGRPAPDPAPPGSGLAGGGWSGAPRRSPTLPLRAASAGAHRRLRRRRRGAGSGSGRSGRRRWRAGRGDDGGEQGGAAESREGRSGGPGRRGGALRWWWSRGAGRWSGLTVAGGAGDRRPPPSEPRPAPNSFSPRSLCAAATRPAPLPPARPLAAICALRSIPPRLQPPVDPLPPHPQTFSVDVAATEGAPLAAPFTIVSSRLDAVSNVAVRVELRSGAVGCGRRPCCHPSSTRTSRPRSRPAASLGALLDEVTGVLHGHAFASVRNPHLPSPGSQATAGVEMALIDAVANSIHIPLW
ncbi:CASP-like protein 4A1 [Setaria italica]|uniref:CASP-like protein 4A1 n=1 Tax=Setaria italica TaxID=4555 RepID=UPI000645F1A6|nr:CASP-like protein 4A1 [Setaria italica]